VQAPKEEPHCTQLVERKWSNGFLGDRKTNSTKKKSSTPSLWKNFEIKKF